MTGTMEFLVHRVKILSIACATSLLATGSLSALAVEPQIASAYISVALKSDGTVWAWGNACNTTYARQMKNNSGAAISGVKGIATNGLYGITLINADGTLQRSSGCGTAWETVRDAAGALISNVVQASASGSTAFVKGDGTVWNFGSNDYGQLGTGSAGAATQTPVQVKTSASTYLTGVQSVRVNELYSVALKFDGTVWIWGYSWRTPGNYYATQLKDKSGIAITNVRSIGAGGNSIFHLIKNDGSLWAFDNRAGTNLPVLDAKKVGLTNARTVDGTYMYGCNAGIMSKADGTVWQWGCSPTASSPSAYPAFAVKAGTGTLTDVKTVAGTIYNTLALRHDSSVWQWGTGGAGMSTPLGGFVATPVLDSTGKALTLVANPVCNTP